MRESDPPPDLGAPTPRRRPRLRRGERASEAHGQPSSEGPTPLNGEATIDGPDGAAPSDRVPRSRPTTVTEPEDEVASRSTEEEARDLVALRRARQGDDGSFAELLRAVDPSVHAFVAALVGPAVVDQVVIDAYVKAYRALPLAPDRSPRLWLLQLAITACTDEERRRTRQRLRDRPDRAAAAGPPVPPAVPTSLAEEHRILVALVDGAGLTVREAAKVIEAEPAAARAGLRQARLAFHQLPSDQTDNPTRPLLAPAGVAAPHDPEFWNEVGTALLGARATPATARLSGQAPPVPPAPTNLGRGRRTTSGRAEALRAAERARHGSGTRPLAKLGMAAAIGLSAVCLVGIAAWLVGNATHRDAALGLTSQKVLDRVDHSLTINDTISATIHDAGGAAPATATLLRTSDGSYRYLQASPMVDEAWDTTTLRATRVADSGGAGSRATIVDVRGVSPGPPGLPLAVCDGHGDPLLGAVRLVRAADGATVTSAVIDERPVWVVRARLGRDLGTGGDTGLVGIGRSGSGRAGDRLTLTVDQSLLLPVRFRQVRDGTTVTDVTFSDYTVGNPLPADSFTAALPTQPGPDTAVTSGDWGFRVMGLEQARRVAPELTVTPGFTPDGFTLASVAVRTAEPVPVPDPALTRVVDRAGPVVVLVYRRGSQQLVVTARPPGSAADPRSPWPGTLSSSTGIGSGRFAGTTAKLQAGTVTRLWVADGDAVVSVAGDVSTEQVTRIARSLR